MRVLITGGAGFLGSHLADKLMMLGNSVTIYDNFMRGEEAERNIREIAAHVGSGRLEVVKNGILNFERMKEAVEDKDLILHFAALPSHRLAMKEPRNYAEVDVVGTVNVLESARLAKSSPVVLFASSNKVYGKRKDAFKEGDVLRPEGPYGLSKMCAEEFCKMYVNYYGLDIPVIRYHHVIGPRCQPDRELSIFTEQVINDQAPIVHGHFANGEFSSCAADYTNVYDVVDATIEVASKIKGFDIFNLATGEVTTVQRIAELVAEVLNKNHIKPEPKEMLPHESLLHSSDASKLRTVLGIKLSTPVDVSVKQYVEWRLKCGARPQAIYRDG